LNAQINVEGRVPIQDVGRYFSRMLGDIFRNLTFFACRRGSSRSELSSSKPWPIDCRL
jgi:hypothetical protein